MYYEKELELIKTIKEISTPEEADAAIDTISEHFTKIQKIAPYVDLFATNRARAEKELETWEENYEAATRAIKEVNQICLKVKFPQIFPDREMTNNEIYDIGTSIETDVFEMTSQF